MIGLSNCSNQDSTKLSKKKLKYFYSIQPTYVIIYKKWNQEYCKVRFYLWFETLCIGLIPDMVMDITYHHKPTWTYHIN